MSNREYESKVLTMKLDIVPLYGTQEILGDRMLFVRTDSISEIMVKVPILVAGIIIAIAIMPIQYSSSSTRSLDLITYPDGMTHVSTQIMTDPLDVDYELDLFGSTIDNFVATGEDGFLLSADIIGNHALIETFSSSIITVEYDIHDLVSKQGRVWTFSLNAPTDFTLLLPENSVIVAMTNLPTNMGIVDNQNQLTLLGGDIEVDYIFGASIGIDLPGFEISLTDLTYAMIGVAAAVVGMLAIIRLKHKNPKPVQTIPTVKPNAQSVFKVKPDIRDDDKEIVKFIFDNGGQVLESDLRKKFLQPRTTMWRAVKRLERNGIIEIEKKDLQNLVKLCKNVEEEK